MIDSKSYGAISIVIIGAILILFSNICFDNYHVESIELAFKLLQNNTGEILTFWFLTLIGAAFQISGVFAMVKVTWRNIKFSNYEYNPLIHLLILLIVVIISIYTIYFAIKAVLGLVLIAIITMAILNDNDKKR
ncbi:hypothetical protein [Lysinibacillus xylanilyticus]|uniref:hypothetical protein n=1 Tax=Lysinibacillus xylanilyticus TaxID=582475 RepID=UPI003D02BF18